MSFRESWTNVVRKVTDIATRRKTPVDLERTSTPPPTHERPSGVYFVPPSQPAQPAAERPSGVVVKNHRQLAREREQAAKQTEQQKNAYKKRNYEELHQSALEILSDLRAIAPALPEQTRAYLEGYQNEYDSLVKTQYENALYNTEVIRKNTERIAELQPQYDELTRDIERLRHPQETPEGQEDTRTILALCERFGMPLPQPAEHSLSTEEKLAALQKLRTHLAANKQTSLKAIMLFTKLGKQSEENKLLDNVLQNMEKRRAASGAEIQRLTEENEAAKKRNTYIQGQMADFVSEIDRSRSKVAERSSMPPNTG